MQVLTTIGHPDPHSGGGTSYGVTSFFKPHQNWGSEKNRADLPDCVFKWPSDKETARDSSSDGPDDDAEDEARRCRQDYPGPMKWGDKILLDHRNQPVADHDIPATLSGSTPGYKLQAMRLLNPNITQYDLLARMPRQIQREKKGVVSVKYLGTKNTHVNMPMQRFRDTAGCIAGARREGSRVIIEGLLKLFGHHGFDPAKSGSTRGFPRNLKPWEKMEVKLGNAGSYSNRAGTRALNGQKRKATHEKMLKAIDNGKKRDAAKGGKPASNTEIDAVKASRQSSPEQAGDISEALQQPPASIGTLDHQASTVETESGAGQVSEDDAPSKRRRKNATPAAKSRQPSLRKNGRAPQTQRYGAEGAPVPFPPPEAFDFSANNTFLPNTGDISTHLSQRLQPRFEGYKTQQVLGKHGRGQPMDQWNEDTHVPQQYSSEQNTQDTYSPQPKRRRMPKTGGYYAPLLQVPEMQLVKKARGVERDAHLGAPQLNIDDTVPEVYGTPQLEEQHLTPSPLSISGSIVNPDEDARAEEALLVNSQTSPVANEEGPEPLLGPVPGQFEQDLDEAPGAEEALLVNNQAPQAAKEQGSQPPLAPVPGHAGQELPIDIRDVPPADGWQSQSLHNALAYTRDSYREWTGEEAPVTNLEDCYNVQYREIEIAFQLWWISEKNPQFWDPLPELFQVKAWSGTVWDWEAPESMEYLQEPRRRGRQAARNEDGSLQQPEFHWNLEDHSWYDANAEEEL